MKIRKNWAPEPVMSLSSLHVYSVGWDDKVRCVKDVDVVKQVSICNVQLVLILKHYNKRTNYQLLDKRLQSINVKLQLPSSSYSVIS